MRGKPLPRYPRIPAKRKGCYTSRTLDTGLCYGQLEEARIPKPVHQWLSCSSSKLGVDYLAANQPIRIMLENTFSVMIYAMLICARHPPIPCIGFGTLCNQRLITQIVRDPLAARAAGPDDLCEVFLSDDFQSMAPQRVSACSATCILASVRGHRALLHPIQSISPLRLRQHKGCGWPELIPALQVFQEAGLEPAELSPRLARSPC